MWSVQKVVVAYFICILCCVYSATITWNPDAIQIKKNFTHVASKHWQYSLTIKSNGPLYPVKTGHVSLRFNISINHLPMLNAYTPCLRLTSPFEDHTKIVGNSLVGRYPLSVGDDLQLNNLFTITIQKSFENYVNSTTKGVTTFSIDFLAKRNITSFSIYYSTTHCEKLRTVGNWNDPHRWNLNRVPTTADKVIIPSNAGVIHATASVTVSSFQMDDGLLVLQSSSCPIGWTVDNRYDVSQKCYRLVEAPLGFYDAERYCTSSLGAIGSTGTHLVHIGDRTESELLYRICRGSKLSLQYKTGCWLGLWNDGLKPQFQWLDWSSIGNNDNENSLFFDFRRYEPNNHTVSLGTESMGGERCTTTVPWQIDPLLLEQGGWNDDACANPRPFVCQTFATTVVSTFTVTNSTLFNGGVVEGGNFFTGNGKTTINSLVMTRSNQMYFQHTKTSTSPIVVKSLYLIDNVQLSIGRTVKLLNNSIIGETEKAGVLCPNCGSAQSTIIFTGNSTIQDEGSHSISYINCSVILQGTTKISSSSNLVFVQGGDFSQGTTNYASTSSAIAFADYAVKFVSYDAYELRLTHSRAVMGEFYGIGNFTSEMNNQYRQISKGVYKLTISGYGKSSGTKQYFKQTTPCIPYNASAEYLRDTLNALSLIGERGGVTVRLQYGDQTDRFYGFGYTYRIELDSVLTNQYDLGSLELSMACYGLFGCGCAETKVSIVGPDGARNCPIHHNISLIEPNSCIIAPQIWIDRISTISYLQTKTSTAAGQLVLLDGYHKLPPQLYGTVIAKNSAIGVVATDDITWTGLQIIGSGKIIAAGTGWTGWDSSYLIFAPDWTERRGLTVMLDDAPQSNLFVDSVVIDGRGSFYTTGPGSNTTWRHMIFSGGEVGGRSVIHITRSISLEGTMKSVNYGIVLNVIAGAIADWSEGNITLGNGANIIVEGLFNITNVANFSDPHEFPVTIGNKESMNDVPSNALFPEVAGRNWQSYYDATLDPYLRPGWYDNALCGNLCRTYKMLTIRANGLIRTGPNSNTMFLLPLNVTGQTRFEVGENAKVQLVSGGVFGNGITVNLALGTLLELSGGKMSMEADCSIKGSGELIVSAGSHDLSFVIDAHITIKGTGVLIWPQSHGSNKKITFKGGLLIEELGQLQILAYSTTIDVYKEVRIKDQGVIQFPLLGIASQASPYDQADAPDTSPRGALLARGTMIWEGGTLRGKADFNALSILYIDGDVKYISSLAKLVNKGHCEWGTGDLIASDQGDFLNLGTIQMRYGVGDFASSALYKGTELPIENGGDVFALEYNSWDVDNGALSYAQYIELRTKFVSRVPPEWYNTNT